MKRRQSLQYTIRQVPLPLDRRLREKARDRGESLNQVVLEALKQQAGFGDTPLTYHDLDALVGTWEEDPEFELVLKLQDQIDHEAWK